MCEAPNPLVILGLYGLNSNGEEEMKKTIKCRKMSIIINDKIRN